jgi:hypothetical protein
MCPPLTASSSTSVNTSVSEFVCSNFCMASPLESVIVVLLFFAREGPSLNPWSKEYLAAFLAAVLHVTQ